MINMGDNCDISYFVRHFGSSAKKARIIHDSCDLPIKELTRQVSPGNIRCKFAKTAKSGLFYSLKMQLIDVTGGLKGFLFCSCRTHYQLHIIIISKRGDLYEWQ